MPDDAAPTAPKMPTKPEGFRNLRLYSPLWRGSPGDSIAGAVIGYQPCELPDGSDRTCVMLQLLSRKAPCIVLDGATTRFEHLAPVETVSPTSSQIVGVVLVGPALSRLLSYADQPSVQIVDVHALAPEGYAAIDDVSKPAWAEQPFGVVNPITGERVRYVCFIGEKTSERVKYDPVEIVRLEEVRRAAREAQGAT